MFLKYFIVSLILSALFTLISCSEDETSTPTEETVSLADNELEIAKISVNTTAVGLGNWFHVENLGKSDYEAFCRIYIENIRFFEDKSGYYFIEDMDANMVAHGVNPDLVGENRYDVQDENGKYYVREMIDSLNANGSGIVEYYFNNPATNQIEQKIAYVMTIPNSDLFIGSGYYTDQSDRTISKMEANKNICKAAVESIAIGLGNVFDEFSTDNQLMFADSFIDPIRFFPDQSGYFFFYNVDGTCLVHPLQPEIEGNNRYEHTDSHGEKYIAEMCELAKSEGSGFVEYYKENFTTKQNEKKISFIMAIPGTEYFIGAGVYLE